MGLRESLHLYPAVETLHVVSLALFVGPALLFDLRLLGFLFADVPVSRLRARLLPMAAAGALPLLLSGLLLFYANPLRTFHSVWFRLKVALLVLSAINILVFRARFRGRPGAWDLGPPPWSVRLAGGLSLLAWLGAIVAGRLIAFHWFDCEKLTPGWLYSLAQCAATGG